MPGPKTNEREGTRAVLRHARVSPTKVRVVLDLVRNKDVGAADEILRFSERDAAIIVRKLLHSAVANAENNDQLDPEELFVSACYADEATGLRRFRPRARGRIGRIRKRGSHITVIVSRLPEDRLARLRAKQEQDVTNRRSRRVAASRGDDAAGGRRRRVAASRGETPVASDEASIEQEEVSDESVEAPVEDQIEAAADVAEVSEEVGAVDPDATEATAEPTTGATAEPAADQQDEAPAAEVAPEADDEERKGE